MTFNSNYQFIRQFGLSPPLCRWRVVVWLRHILTAGTLSVRFGDVVQRTIPRLRICEIMTKKVITFTPLTFSAGTITVDGGYAAKPRAAPVQMVDDGFGNNLVFLKISKQQEWLVHAALGEWCTRSKGLVFDKHNLLEGLRGKIKQYSNGELSVDPVPHNADVDPMDAIGTETSSSDTSPSKTASRGGHRGGDVRLRYYRNHARGKVVRVDMPASGHAPDQISPEFRQIRLFIMDRKTIWLHQDDVNWLVRILAKQANCSRLSDDASIVSA